MTAPAAAPSSAPIAPPARRASPQPPADRFAFAAVLDSIPGAATKAGASAAEGPPHPSEEPRQEESAPEQSTRHSLLNDCALLASLPFALRAASAMDEGSQAADHASSLAPAATKASGAEASGAPVAPGAKAAAVGRLTGERAFHFGASAGAMANRSLAIDGPFAPAGADVAPQAGQGGESALAADFGHAQAMAAKPFAAAVPASDSAPAPASIAPRAAGTATNRVSPARAATHDAARSGRKPEVPAPPPVTRLATSAAAHAPAEPSGKPHDGRLPDPIVSAAPTTAQTGSFGAQLSAAFTAGSSFAPDASTASVAGVDIAPRASALAASPAAAGPPVREIDVDLSPGGLEDVSMTMRLAGDKLSVVIRAASSQTLSSIEGARDAIADRMAAIGQPLELAHCQAGGRQR